MKKEFGEYYLGLDVGTSSVGWAVTDLQYNLMKINSKAMWGIRLFNAADTAANTRTQRTARRRLARQKWRISMLQELFAAAISEIDPGFFMRMKESNLYLEDKEFENRTMYSLFDDVKFKDADYHKKFPTIYHLRKALMDGEQLDVRLVYLALHHIIKHRGHFLSEGLDASNVREFMPVFNEMQQCVNENIAEMENWDCPNVKELELILANKFASITEKKKGLEDVIGKESSPQKTLAKLLAGAKGSLSDLFTDYEEPLKASDKNSFGFKKDDYDVVRPEIEGIITDKIIVLDTIKAVYDWSVLVSLLGSYSYISDAKIATYEEHKDDLQILKSIYKEFGRNHYNKLFGKPKDDATVNYSSYVGYLKGGKEFSGVKPTQEEFCEFLKKDIKETMGIDIDKIAIPTKSSKKQDKLFYKIAQKKAFPKQISKENGVIPMQIHRAELEKILDNASRYLLFLNNKDANSLSVKNKIIDIFNFRVPYYVGPLAGNAMSKAKGRCWVERKQGKIYPWNFTDIVDEEKSAEKFIKKMTNKCSYLVGEDVLPKESLLYSEFLVRNELSNLKIDGQRIKKDILENIYRELFVKSKNNRRISKKRIEDFLKQNNIRGELSGLASDEIKATLKSLKDFRRIFGQNYIEPHREEIENIIKWITIFPDATDMLAKKILREYPLISQEQIKEIKKLRYKEWGNLSEKLLNSKEISFVDTSTGEIVTIIAALRETGKNFAELLSSTCIYRFDKKIDEFNNGTNKVSEITYDKVEELMISPAVKRSIWQTILIVKEIKKIMGHGPKKIFIEMAREEGAKKKTKSRKTVLLELYKNCKKEAADFDIEIDKLVGDLTKVSDSQLRSKKLYLYYTQLGRNMYNCNETIELVDLNNNNLWDGDHIFPRSRTKNDSLENLVLVDHKRNMDKGDTYPLSNTIQKNNMKFWHMLLNKGLISQGKYDKLVRKFDFTEEELAGFISRQLVETRQSTKAIATLLKEECVGSTIVYSKAENVSDFRQEYSFIKCRDVNDLHHAKDAFLNIVVGNVYDVKFTNNPIKFIKSREPYSLNTKQIYKKDINKEGVFAWKAGDEGTLATVRAIMHKNNILFTRMQLIGKGQLYDVGIMKAGKGQVPLKQGKSIEKYGGYNKAGTAFFTLVESVDNRDKKIRTIESVPIYLAQKQDESSYLQYLKEEVKLNNPRILVKKISLNSLFNFDGCLINITGKGGNQIVGTIASELIIGTEYEQYIKEIFKWQSILTNGLATTISGRSIITKDKNLRLYNEFVLKHKKQAYKNRPSGQINLFEEKRQTFADLLIEDQIKVLCEITKLFKCDAGTSDLKLIGGSKNAGKIALNKNIEKKRAVIMINQSVTGIFEKRVDLLTL